MVPGLLAAGTLAVGQRHSCAVDQSGSVLCWGMHEGGQLGIGVTTEECPIGPEGELRPCAAQPVPVDAGPYTAVAAGLYHTCALRVNGQVECWGDDDSGQLGLETGGTESCDWLIAVSSTLGPALAAHWLWPVRSPSHSCQLATSTPVASKPTARLNAGVRTASGKPADWDAPDVQAS